VRTAPGPYPPDLSRWAIMGPDHAGSSRTPLRLARRTRPIWQSWARPGFVRAAPALPGTTRIRLPSATATCCDRPQAKVSHLRSNYSASRRTWSSAQSSPTNSTATSHARHLSVSGSTEKDASGLMDQCSRRQPAGTPPHQRSCPPRGQRGHGLRSGIRCQAEQVLTRWALPEPSPALRANPAAPIRLSRRFYSPLLLPEADVADQRGRHPRPFCGPPPSAMRPCPRDRGPGDARTGTDGSEGGCAFTPQPGSPSL
jgi:hypothetical protein